MNIELRILVSGLLFLFTLGSGVWLSHSGKPLNTLIFTIHKLIALAAVIFTATVIYDLLKNVAIRVDLLTLMIITGLLVLALFISGALLSLGRPLNDAILTTHKVIPFLTAISTAATIYLLSGSR